MADYDIVFLAGGWGAAFDFGFSETLADQITEANALGKVIGGVCHGPLGLRNAKGADGEPLVEGPPDLGGDRQAGARARHRVDAAPSRDRAAGDGRALRERDPPFRDPLANHWVVDGNLVTGQNQNAGPMVAREMMQLVADAVAAKGARHEHQRAPLRPGRPRLRHASRHDAGRRGRPGVDGQPDEVPRGRRSTRTAASRRSAAGRPTTSTRRSSRSPPSARRRCSSATSSSSCSARPRSGIASVS